MSARITRGGPQRGRTASKSPARGKAVRKGRVRVEESQLPEAVRRASWWIFLFMLVALALAIATAFRLPQMAGTAVGEAIGEAGFAVRHVEIRGLERMKNEPVYQVADEQLRRAMPLVDLEGTRQRLLRFGWVQDARVSRRFPDTLVVDIVERRPAAIWQHNRTLALIDPQGVVLEPVKLDAMPDLPLVIGPAANRQVTALARLIRGAPHLKPMIAGASWIGGRRWDIRFQSGEVLTLPEGEEAAARALAYFARKDQSVQLLGRGFVRIDMRDPSKMTIRISKEPGSVVPDLAPQAAPDPSVDTSKTI